MMLFLGLPFLIAAELLRTCGAWINDGTRRCRRPRQGFLRRCGDHQGQIATGYDLSGALAFGIGVLNVLLLAYVFFTHHN
ncbi:hypothetical protein E3G54_004998 [Mycobacteroides abscessus]|nr:hypothetical protein [Mycobacteroides abscessus]